MRRTLWILGGAGAALALVMLMAPTFGFPSRPRFAAVGVNVAAPATNGDIRATRLGLGMAPTRPLEMTSTVGGVASFDSTHASGPFTTYSRSATAFGDIGNGAQMGGGMTLDSLGIMPRAGSALELGANATAFFQLQSNGVSRFFGPSPTVRYDETDAAANERLWECAPNAGQFVCRTRTDADGAGATWLAVDRTGTVVDSIDLAATAVTINGGPIVAETSGTFTGTLTGYAAPPTGTVNYRKIGNSVTLYLTVAITGTSNANTFTMTGLPAAVQPANTLTVICGSMTDNGVAVIGNCDITTSVITFAISLVVGTQVRGSPSGWLTSGAKGLTNTWQISYNLE